MRKPDLLHFLGWRCWKQSTLGKRIYSNYPAAAASGTSSGHVGLHWVLPHLEGCSKDLSTQYNLLEVHQGGLTKLPRINDISRNFQTPESRSDLSTWGGFQLSSRMSWENKCDFSRVLERHVKINAISLIPSGVACQYIEFKNGAADFEELHIHVWYRLTLQWIRQLR